MVRFMISAVLAVVPLASQAGFESCVVSRNGNEFWLRHQVIKNDTCSTSVVLENLSGVLAPGRMEITFRTDQKDINAMDIALNGRTLGSFSFQGQLSVDLSPWTQDTETLVISCTQGRSNPKAEKTVCEGLQAYPSDPERLGKIVPDISRWTEFVPR